MVDARDRDTFSLDHIENRDMKVLIFTTQLYKLGGAERLAVELAEELAKRPEIEVDVLCQGPEGEPRSGVVHDRLVRAGVRSVRFLGRPFRSGAKAFIPTLHRLRRVIKEGNYDIVETSLPGPRIFTAFATVGLAVRHVAGIHDCYDGLRKGIGAKLDRWVSSINRNTAYYAISQEAALAWERFSGVGRERIRTIYNSIHQSYFSASQSKKPVCAEFGLNTKLPLLLFVGRLTLRKGLDVLVEGVCPLAESGEVSLLLVGAPNTAIEPSFGETPGFLERLQSRLSGCSNIHMTGFRDDVPRLMGAADILVHPARHEAFGLVLAEAMSCSLPIVTTNVGGILEVVEGTDTICLPAGNPDALKDGIERILRRTDEEKKQCRDKAYKRAKFFRTSRRADEMLSYFQSLLSKRS